MDNSQELLKKMDSKLGILIALQMLEEKPKKLKDKIKLLHNLGAETAEIAAILNTSIGLVSKERSLIKRDQGKK